MKALAEAGTTHILLLFQNEFLSEETLAGRRGEVPELILPSKKPSDTKGNKNKSDVRQNFLKHS